MLAARDDARSQGSAVSGATGGVAVPRDVMRWLQGLNLTKPFKNLRRYVTLLIVVLPLSEPSTINHQLSQLYYQLHYRDFANGYLVAEIIARYQPGHIHAPAYYTGTSAAARRNNWDQLAKAVKKNKWRWWVADAVIRGVERGDEAATLEMLETLYETFAVSSTVFLLCAYVED